MRATSARALAALLLTLLAVTGCVRMPESGPVVEAQSEGNLDEPPGIYIDPRPPQPGESAPDVVAHFLDAMTATPIQTNVAKQFLTRDAQASWNPEAETITYADASPPRGATRVSVRLAGAERLDARGAYRGRLEASRRTLEFPMSREDGEWRIAQAPDALVVPESWFEQRFRQVALYFFDPTARILVPDPVFVPRGEQLATALTKALLRGPPSELQDVSRSFIPPGLTFGLSVPVSEEGVAEIALRGYAGQLTPQASELMLAQLAWTLRQEPTITALRVTVGGQEVTLPGTAGPVDVDAGSAYDPTGVDASSLLYGLRDGLLVAGPPDGLGAVDGPMGSTELGVRSIAVSLDATRVAGVSGAGDRVLVSSVRGPEQKVEQVVSGAQNLLEPAWDFTGRMWLVDNTAGGAEVSYVVDDEPQSLRVPGVTGGQVTEFLVSRDGSRLVAVVRRARGDRVLVSRIRHDDQGRVVGASRSDPISWEGASRLRVNDIAWSSPTSVAVLHRLAKELYEVRTISVDGAPSGLDSLLTRLPSRVVSLAGSPHESDTLFAVTGPELVDLGQGVSLSAALAPGVTVVDYVG